MREIRIGYNEKEQRLDKLLLKYMPQAGKGFIYKMLRKKNITLNDHKADGSEILAEGDSVKLWLAEDTIEKFVGRREELYDDVHDLDAERIIYEDNDILIYDKPAGVLSQKAEANDISLNDMFLKYMGGPTATFTPSICNRLDRNTSGLIICGKTLKGLQDSAQMLKSHDLHKDYLAIVEGVLSYEREIKTEIEGKQLHSIVKPIGTDGDMTAVMVRIFTGKTHQVRIHMSYIGHPIVGDRRYGHGGAKRQLLHSYRLTFPDGRKFEAPIPEDFRWEHGKPEDFEDLPSKI